MAWFSLGSVSLVGNFCRIFVVWGFFEHFLCMFSFTRLFSDTFSKLRCKVLPENTSHDCTCLAELSQCLV